MKQLPLLLLWFSVAVQAQTDRWGYADSLFSTYYHQRWTLFQNLPDAPGDILFVGNSITDGGEWEELFPGVLARNRGISGDISAGVLHRLEEVAKGKPQKVFLLIGINDLARNISPDSLVRNILHIRHFLKQESPATQLYVQSLLPVSDVFGKFSGHTGKNREVLEVNRSLQLLAKENGFIYVDLHTGFSDAEGKLHRDYSNDGLHLTGKGYLLWKRLIYPQVLDLEPKPALLPSPQQIAWQPGSFFLADCRSILVPDPSLMPYAALLQKELRQMGWEVGIAQKSARLEGTIQINLGKVDSPQHPNEAYHLTVTSGQIALRANTAHGIFNGIQTLLQLLRDGVGADACEIADWPAFSWRGFMIDAARNYVPMDQLRELIGVMGRYKLNIFHLHLTEDIAWRLAIDRYPQLTAPEHMLRDKGEYYSKTELKELIDRCRSQHITLVPEIDMPGHSAAFQRAFQTEMQSDSGLALIKDILHEVCQSFDTPILHIGADEVKITNPRFVPEVTKLVESYGKSTVGWQPGGNFSDRTIRQLWLDDKGKFTGNQTIPYIDSRHLYLNHMDPLESVVTIFHRQIGNRVKGDSIALGGTLCLWHDRAVGEAKDQFTMNPVYPGILAFSERIWRGGGQAGWISNLSEGDVPSFTGFENRLLDHKRLFFAGKPFPYARQSQMNWQLIGPFDNKGDTTASFDLESTLWKETSLPQGKAIVGGTVILRHWWTPMIKGLLDDPKENTTYYATTQLWSEADTVRNFWVGFSNPSRSQATDAPPAGAWDRKGSAAWVNGAPVRPPQWKRPGQTGHLEIPFTDEGYEYRPPMPIRLKKGWNTVLVKAPVGSFKATSWHNPVKWMFTFVPVD